MSNNNDSKIRKEAELIRLHKEEKRRKESLNEQAKKGRPTGQRPDKDD